VYVGLISDAREEEYYMVRTSHSVRVPKSMGIACIAAIKENDGKFKILNRQIYLETLFYIKIKSNYISKI